jgi:hypothetical protein
MGGRSKPSLADTCRMSVVMVNIFCALYRKEPSMNAVQVEQKNYEMPPRDGISIAHSLTVADVERSMARDIFSNHLRSSELRS